MLGSTRVYACVCASTQTVQEASKELETQKLALTTQLERHKEELQGAKAVVHEQMKESVYEMMSGQVDVNRQILTDVPNSRQME